MSARSIAAKKNSIYLRIREIVETARHNIARTVNFEMVKAYWLIGKEIIEEEQKGKLYAVYGRKVIEKLAARLSNDFGSGFTVVGLWNMRQFYQTYPILSALRRELSWTHYRTLMRIDPPGFNKGPLCPGVYWPIIANEIFVSRYKLYLPSEKELVRELKRF